MSTLKKILIGLGLSLVTMIGVVWWWLTPRVDDIPEVLDEIDEEAEAEYMQIVIPAQGPLPELRFQDLKGQTTFFIVEGQASMQAKEGREVKKAINRWITPDDVVGYSIGDAEGFGVLAGRIERDFLGPMRPEMPRPLYADFEGAIMHGFKMPAGHMAIVVLDPEGKVAYRSSGDPTDEQIAELKQVLGATEPPPAPPAPDFEEGELTNATCEGKGCAFIFLGRSVARADVPGIENGFDGGMKEAFEQMKDPSIRLMTVVHTDWRPTGEQVGGAIVGEATDLEVEGWPTLESAPELRRVFDVEPEETALVIIDREGKLVFNERGLIPLYKFTPIQDWIDVEHHGFDGRE